VQDIGVITEVSGEDLARDKSANKEEDSVAESEVQQRLMESKDTEEEKHNQEDIVSGIEDVGRSSR
jgi:hypothetical protein